MHRGKSEPSRRHARDAALTSHERVSESSLHCTAGASGARTHGRHRAHHFAFRAFGIDGRHHGRHQTAPWTAPPAADKLKARERERERQRDRETRRARARQRGKVLDAVRWCPSVAASSKHTAVAAHLRLHVPQRKLHPLGVGTLPCQ